MKCYLAAGGCGRANCFLDVREKSELSFLHEIACYHLSHGRTGSSNRAAGQREAGRWRIGIEKWPEKEVEAVAEGDCTDQRTVCFHFKTRQEERAEPSVNSCNSDDILL